jgi:hypothetical protein
MRSRKSVCRIVHGSDRSGRFQRHDSHFDEQGKVASEVAAGAPAVLALARAGQQTEA